MEIRALKEYAMGMAFALVQSSIHVLFMDVTERIAVIPAYLATFKAFAIRIWNVTSMWIQLSLVDNVVFQSLTDFIYLMNNYIRIII